MSFDKEAWKAECRENARSLETEISRLQSDYSDPLGFWRRYDEFWADAKLISAMFKEPLFRDDRERLWAGAGTRARIGASGLARKARSGHVQNSRGLFPGERSRRFR
jgi:hypothetical protein